MLEHVPPISLGKLRELLTVGDCVFIRTGFNLRRAHRQFCSRYVREVLAEATGISVGEVESFATLLSRRPNTDVGFWRMWYFGRIPWSRETVSPVSLLESPHLAPVFDGFAATADGAP